MRRVSILLLVVLALLAGACSTIPYEQEGIQPVAVRPADGSSQRAELNTHVYDAAVSYIGRLFLYRKDFNGVDFAAQARARRGAAVSSTNEADFYAHLGDLLSLLEDDHTYALSPSARERLRALRAGDQIASYGIRLVGDDHIVAMVRPGSPAAEAGVLPGWQLVSIDGQPVSASGPPVAGRSKALLFLDDADHKRTLELTARMMRPFPRHEIRRLDGGFAYLRFDDFDRSTYEWLAARMAQFAEHPPRGLILDLRRNGGGAMNFAALIHSFFHARPVVLAILKGRIINRRLIAAVPEHPYADPMIVLVGPATASAAELLAARLRETGRASVIGQRTRGATLGTRAIELPDGGLLHIGMIAMSTADGRDLDKVGVEPDQYVAVDRLAVREGRDPVLEAAIVALAALPANEGGAGIGMPASPPR